MFFDDEMFLEYLLRIGTSVFCGIMLGIERKTRQNNVGIRTLVLITISCCLLSILSVYMSNLGLYGGDPTRIASTSVTGIGFIGGGAIVKNGLNIKGLTTAAIILTAAAIGLSCGAGLYVPAIFTLVIALAVLFLMNKLENLFFPAVKTKHLRIRLDGTDINQEKIKKVITDSGLIITDSSLEYTAKKEQTELTYTVKAPDKLDALKLAEKLGSFEKLINFTFTEN